MTYKSGKSLSGGPVPSEAQTNWTRRRPRAGRPPRTTVSVDNNRCHLYAICQMEAPEVFDVGTDGRLRYVGSPPADRRAEVRQAARLCPMQAIAVREG